MPDLATMQAARPKCPKPVAEYRRMQDRKSTSIPCGRPLRLGDWENNDGPIYECPVHGATTTMQSLVARQGLA